MSFQIKFANCMGLGHHNSTLNITKISHKVKEFVLSTDQTETIFILLETKLKPNSKSVRLPNRVKYIAETSCPSGSGGILVFADKHLLLHNPVLDVQTIVSKHALYFRIDIHGNIHDNIVVYLPCDINECINVLQQIEVFLDGKNIYDFHFYGDCNIDFQSKQHMSKAKVLLNLLQKFNLFDVAEKLDNSPKFTWQGLGDRYQSSSKIDHFFSNINTFNTIAYNHNSFSDHLDITVSYKKNFVYRPPSWKVYLFRQKEFIEMLKRETLIFLFEKSNISQQDFSMYEENPQLLDDNLKFDDHEYKECSVFFDLLKHLKSKHDKFFSKQKTKNYQKTKEFNEQMNNLVNEMHNSNVNSHMAIKELREQQQAYFRQLVYSQAEFKFMRKLRDDGHSNKLTFECIKESRKLNYSLKIDGEISNDNQDIVNTFAKIHSDIVSNHTFPSLELDELLQNYGLTLADVFPQITTLTSPNSTTKQFKEVIKTISNTSATGISTEPPILFDFLLDLLPNFTTKALNLLYHINIDESPFAFIKDRNVIHIPKKDCDQSDPVNHRPISLLETVYKLLSKALNKKLAPHLKSIVHCDQIGYIPNRNRATASVSITAAMNVIKNQNHDAQLISFDFSKAFDKILPQIIQKLLDYIFPNGNFAKSIISLTNGGRFRSIFKNKFSKFFKIVGGTPQGDPLSGSKFDIVNHVFIACLMSKKLKPLTYQINSKPLNPISYADDNFGFFTLRSNQDVQILKNLLLELKHCLGLQINFKKTKILTNGNYPTQLNEIGQVVASLKHLGIYLSFDENLSYDLTYKDLCTRLEKKAQNISMKSSFNLFKRRNLTTALLNSMCFHIFRIYLPNEKFSKRIWKTITKFLWSVKFQGNISFRCKISQKRLELNYLDGGLNMLLPDNQAFSVWITSFISTLQHAKLNPNSVLSCILNHKHVPIVHILNNFGHHSVLRYSKAFKSLYPSSSRIYFEKLSEYFFDLEKDQSTFLYSSILASQWSNIQLKFSLDDAKTLTNNNLLTIASILETRQIGEKVMFLPILSSDLKCNMSICLSNKLEMFISVIKEKFPNLKVYTKSQCRNLKKPLIIHSLQSKSIFSFHFKRMLRTKLSKTHPAIQTRKNEGIYFPDLETFQMTMKKLFDLPISLHYKSFFFEQYNRTLNSKNKMFKFKLVESNECVQCNTISNTEHSLFNCMFPSFFSDVLAKFLDHHYNGGVPDFLFLKEHFYNFNIFYEIFSKSDYFQISYLILIAKEKSLKISKHESLSKWNRLTSFCHTILVAQFASKLIIHSGYEDNLILNFIDYVTCNKDSLV